MSRLIHNIKTWKQCLSLAQHCTNMRQLKAIQAVFTVHGLHHNNYAISKLVAFCSLSSSGNLSYASLLFTQIDSPNSFICNTLIRAYSRSSRPHLALHYFHLMLNDATLCPDHHTFPFVLIACGNASWDCLGRQIHNCVYKNGMGLADGHIQTALIRFYAECGVLSDARKMFDEISNLDVVQCNVLMTGYLKAGLASEALNVFGDMLVSDIEPDEFCVTTGLTSCAQLGALKQGKWIHEYVEKRADLVSDVYIGTALVDMYAKCGCIDMAVKVFESMPTRNVFSWAAIIGGFGAHGYAREAIHCLERMKAEDGLRPDGVVLLGFLTACTHSGLKREGKFLLENMEDLYAVVPQHEHYSCLVDLLCRSGELNEALELIKRMPMKPLASVWGALLSGCRMHNNVDLAELAVKELLLLDNNGGAQNDGTYVQLSNIYLAARKSEDACRIRKMIGETGLKKTPGCSMLEVDGKVNEFVAGDVSHPNMAEIREMLELMSFDSIHHPLGRVLDALYT